MPKTTTMGADKVLKGNDEKSHPTLFNNRDMCDVTFIVKDKRFYAHKFLLASESEVFYNLFYGPSSVLQNEIEIEDCKRSEDFLEFLSLIYRKTATLTWENVNQLSYLIKKYKISVDTKIFDTLLESTSKCNALEVLQRCVSVGEESMIKECMKVVREHIDELSYTGEFLMLDQPSLEAILKQDNLNIKEIELIFAVDKWCSYQVALKEAKGEMTTKREVIGDALYHLRFPLLKMVDFFKHCSNLTLLTADEFRWLSTEIFWKSEYGYSREDVVAMATMDDREFTTKFPTTVRVKGLIHLPILDDGNYPFFDKENLLTGYTVFSTNTDIWLKGITSDIRVNNSITINNIQFEVECHKPDSAHHFSVWLKEPFQIKAGVEYKLSCLFGYRREYYQLPCSYRWGDLECTVHDSNPRGRYANVRRITFLVNDDKSINYDDEMIVMKQEKDESGSCNII